MNTLNYQPDQLYTAYGQFDDWQKQADSMEKNIDVKQGLIEDE